MSWSYRTAILVAASFLLSASPAGATIYASPSGVDTNPGTQAEPVQTVLKATQLASAGGDTAVELAPGFYAAPLIQTRPAAMTTIRGLGAVVGGFIFQGASNYTVERVFLTGAIKIQNVSHDIRITGVVSRAGTVGVVGPGRGTHPELASHHITVDGSVFEGMTQDGMQIADWNDVLIESNVIRGVRDPAGQIHNDDIQISGGVARAQILGNSLGAVTLPVGAGESSSALQIQGNTPAVPRPTTGVEIRQNAFNRTASTPLQVFGAQVEVTRNVGCQSDNSTGATFGSMGGIPSSGVASWNIWRAWDVQAGSSVPSSNQLVGAC